MEMTFRSESLEHASSSKARKTRRTVALLLVVVGCGQGEVVEPTPPADAGDAGDGAAVNDPRCPPAPAGGESCTAVGLLCQYPCGLPSYPISRVDMRCRDRGDGKGIVTWNTEKQHPCP